MDSHEQHQALKLEWIIAGSPNTFYEWLLERCEQAMKIEKGNEIRSRAGWLLRRNKKS